MKILFQANTRLIVYDVEMFSKFNITETISVGSFTSRRFSYFCIRKQLSAFSIFHESSQSVIMLLLLLFCVAESEIRLETGRVETMLKFSVCNISVSTITKHGIMKIILNSADERSSRCLRYPPAENYNCKFSPRPHFCLLLKQVNCN